MMCFDRIANCVRQELHAEYAALVGFARAALLETKRLRHIIQDAGIVDTLTTATDNESDKPQQESTTTDAD